MNTEQQQANLTSDCVGDASKTALSAERVLGMVEDYGQWLWDAGYMDDPRGEPLVDDATERRKEIRAAIDALQTAAYADGRTDESKEMAGPLALMRDAFDLLESHLGDSEIEYEDDEEEREYAPVQVAARYLMAAIQAMQGDKLAVGRATGSAA